MVSRRVNVTICVEETLVGAVLEAVSSLPGPVRVTVVDAPEGVAALSAEPTRNKVIYRVVNPAIEVPGVAGVIKSYLLLSGPRSAKVIEGTLGRSTKSVQSALWLLRSRGCVVSESV